MKYLACIARAAAVAGAVLFGYLALWPVPIEPDAWTPGPDPGQTGPYVANDDLARATLLPVGAAPDESAPETIARSPRDGRLYTALANGAVIRLPDGTGAAEAVAQVGPRPLGVVFAPDGTLYVAHTSRGILRLAADGTSATVAECGEGRYPRFTDSLYVAADGAVWFTCPSQRFDLSGVRLDAHGVGPDGTRAAVGPHHRGDLHRPRRPAVRQRHHHEPGRRRSSWSTNGRATGCCGTG